MTPTGSEHLSPREALRSTSRRDVIVTSRSASARISTVHATWSNDSSIGSNSVVGSHRATTNSRPTIWLSSTSHQYGCGCALMSPRPSTTLADLFTLLFAANPFSAARASLWRWSSDELEDGLAHGGQCRSRRRPVDSFFPALLF